MPERMRFVRSFFRSTRGLLLVVTGWDALIIAFLSIFSGPMQGLDIPGRLGLELNDAGRVGRIIMLYHALAVPFVAALVYFILDLLPFEPKIPRLVRPTITVGYMFASAGGIGFAYLGLGWIAHGFFIVGLSLVFYAGLVLCVGIFFWRGDDFTPERLAFGLMALYTLVSVIIGGAAGAYFGNGFEAFLAEDTLGLEHDLGQRAIIAHLHIMLTLIDVALLLITARKFNLRGRAYRAAILLTIVGITIVSLATWSVMVVEKIAHKIINVGAAFLLPGAIIIAFYGFAGLIREHSTGPGAGRKLRALFKDPVRFGILFELIFVNLVVTIPGVYTAFNLDTFRLPVYDEVERAIAVGHWHVLATLSAVIALFLVVDHLGVQGRARQFVGWGVLTGSTLAFVFIQFYMFRRPGQEVTWPTPFFDSGIAILLIVLAVFMIHRLLSWHNELANH